jgi:hypothetical protein
VTPLAEHPCKEVASDQETQKPEADASSVGRPKPDSFLRRPLSSG